MDGNDNIYVAGASTGNLYGNINQGGYDLFLTKYSSEGIRLWTKILGSSAEEKTRGMTVDVAGNSYITGYTEGNLDGLPNQGDKDIFVAKYDSDGLKLWVTLLGTSAEDMGKMISVDADGNSYVTGYSYGNLDGNTNAGIMDIFVTKYSSSGIKLWTELFGTSGNDKGNSIVVDSGSGVYIAGWTDGDLAGNLNSGLEDIFISKYSLYGSHIWTELYGTSSNDRSLGIELVSESSGYIVGNSTGNFGGEINAGDKDIYIMRTDLNN